MDDLKTDTCANSARAIDEFGCDYIELTSPVSSTQSYEDCKTICQLGLKVSFDALFHCCAAETDKTLRPRFLHMSAAIVRPHPGISSS